MVVSVSFLILGGPVDHVGPKQLPALPVLTFSPLVVVHSVTFNSPFQDDVAGRGRVRPVQRDGKSLRHGRRGPEETGLRLPVFLRHFEPRAVPAGHQHPEERLSGSQPHGPQPGLEEHDQPQVSCCTSGVQAVPLLPSCWCLTVFFFCACQVTQPDGVCGAASDSRTERQSGVRATSGCTRLGQAAQPRAQL